MSLANDTTILAMLSRYPDMSSLEADRHIEKIQHAENIPICHAVLGRIPRSNLSPEAVVVFDEFQAWSKDRTNRIRNEQLAARRKQQETKLSLRMAELHAAGKITDQVLLMYGISGELPEYNSYISMTPAEREEVWNSRMETRFGPQWKQMLRNQPDGRSPFAQRRRRFELETHCNWLKEGF